MEEKWKVSQMNNKREQMESEQWNLAATKKSKIKSNSNLASGKESNPNDQLPAIQL